MRWSDYLAGLPDGEQTRLVNTLTYGVVQLQRTLQLYVNDGATIRVLSVLSLAHAALQEVAAWLDRDGRVSPDVPQSSRPPDASLQPLDVTARHHLADILGRAAEEARGAAAEVLADGSVDATRDRLHAALLALHEAGALLGASDTTTSFEQ